MKQYCTFIDLIRKKATPGDEPSFKSVIEEAIENNILSDYLKRNSTEAINMLIAEYDYETDIKVKCREAREEASLQNAITIIKKYNLTVEEVARDFNISVTKLSERLNEDKK